VAVRTFGEYLRRLGFTPQKPVKKAYEEHPAKVRKWLKDEVAQIAARPKVEQAEIY
jgi:transposase